MNEAGSRTAAAAGADVDDRQLWTSVRGRLLIVAVSVSMIASVVVLTTWICLRSVSTARSVHPHQLLSDVTVH